MALTVSAQEVRQQLGAYLTKPLSLESGSLSTQRVVSATSLTTGGLNSRFLVEKNGQIVVNDGTNDRVLIGKLA